MEGTSVYKLCHTSSAGGVMLISLTEPVSGTPLVSVMHGQCDARHTVTFPAYAGTNYTVC